MLASNLGKGGFSEVDLEIINQQFYACKKVNHDSFRLVWTIIQ